MTVARVTEDIGYPTNKRKRVSPSEAPCISISSPYDPLSPSSPCWRSSSLLHIPFPHEVLYRKN